MSYCKLKHLLDKLATPNPPQRSIRTSSCTIIQQRRQDFIPHASHAFPQEPQLSVHFLPQNCRSAAAGTIEAHTPALGPRPCAQSKSYTTTKYEGRPQDIRAARKQAGVCVRAGFGNVGKGLDGA